MPKEKVKKKKKEKLPDIEVKGGQIEEGDDDLISDEDLEMEIEPSNMPSFSNPGMSIEEIESMIEDIDNLPLYFKGLFYGEQGTGKTTIGATFPEPILFIDCNEKGTASVRGLGHRVLHVDSWDMLDGAYWYLHSGKHPYNTVVIDTVTQAMDLGMSKVIDMDGHDGLPIKKHWGQLTSLAKTLFINYRNLPMNVVFLAQLKRVNEEDLGDNETYTQVPMISPAVRGSLGAAVDVVGYTHIKEVINTGKNGKEKKTFSYRMRVGPSSDILTKIRVRKGIEYPHILKNPTYEQLLEIISKEA